ncbi:MAG: hypothetical protein EP341_04620 [Sphingomonadales bacterium]|nr:MAG: hypothetical protein EP341_04620 [Sphingomonadales bacterium]
MRNVMRVLLPAFVLACSGALVAQDHPDFHTGPVFGGFGPHAAVDHAQELPEGIEFRVSFDVKLATKRGKSNQHIESAARFMNMHVANGVSQSDIHLALVVHGPPSLDLLSSDAWQARGLGDTNHSEHMIRAMLDAGIRVILCGQSGAAHNIKPDELIPGVETMLSAMTAHALLQQEGYTVNPF